MSETFQRDGRWYQRQTGADGQPFDQPIPDPAAPALPSVVEVNPRRRAPGQGSGGGTGSGTGEADGDREDLVTPYLANRQARGRETDLQMLDGLAASAAEPAQGAGQPAAPAAPATGATDRAPILGGALDAAGAGLRTAADMATQAFVSAPLGAVRNLFIAADDIANWVTGQQPPAEGEAGFAGNPGRAVADLLPQGPDPTSTAGRVTRDIAQFLFGFVGGARAVRGVRGAVTGGARAAAPRTAADAAAEGMTAGAISDFFAQDSNRARLADIWREAGLPDNVLTDFLASEDDDTEAEARLKSTIEGSLMGAAAEGLFLAARGFRAWRRTRNSSAVANEEAAQQAAREAAQQQDEEMVRAAERLLSGRDLGVPDHVAARGVAEAAGEGSPRIVENTPAIRGATDPGPVFINFARISTGGDVQRALQETADAFRGEINAAGRGVQSNAETRELAARLGLTPAQLLDRRTGEAWNAETIHAARELLNSSTERLLELARVAAGPNAGPAEGYAFRRMLATHAAIQAEVLGARREAGRALQAWGMAAGSSREQVAMINDLLEQTGGVSTAQAMAQRLLASADDPAAMATIARAGWGVRSVDAVREAWVNALLSSPATHMANMTSNTLSMATAVIERSAAARMGTTVEQGEAAEMVRAMIGATMDAFRLAGRAYREGSGEMGRLMTSKVDRPNSRAISSEAAGLDPGSTLGRAVDFMGNSIVNAPSRAIQAEDAFFQTFFYRAELRAQALRMARQAEDAIGGLERGSPQYDAAVTARMQELLDSPPEQLRLAAADSALYYTLNRATWGTAAGGGADAPGQLSRGLQQLRDRVQLFGFIMPFLRTPMNAFSFGAERSPLAPLVGQWRADLAAGGARADLALARMSVGTAAMLVAFDFADRGLITGNGPDDPGERENWANLGITPYSIRVGDAWVQYNRLDPIGFIFSLSANMAEMVRRRETELTEVDQPGEIISAALSAVALPMLNRSSMQGLGGVFDAVSRSEMSAANFANQFAGSFVPGVVAGAERAMDPAGSQVMTPYDAVLARIPGLSASLPPRRNRWGEVVVPEDPAVVLANAFGPARISPERTSPIDAEMERLNLNVQRMPLRQDFGAALGGGSAPVQLNSFPEVYDRLAVLAGNEWRDPGTNLGLRDRLDAMVQGRGQDGGVYRMLSDGRQGGKAQMILAIVEQHRLGARMALLMDPAFAEFRAFVEARRQETMEMRAPLAR